MGDEKIGDKIIEFLTKNKGQRFSIKEVARKIDALYNYTWVIKKCISLNKDGIIELEDGIIVSSQGNKVISKQVWIK